MYEAVIKAVCQPQCESVKENEPRNNQRYTGLKVSCPGSQYQYVRKGECVLTCRGLSSQRVDELFISELGRTISCPRSSRLNRRGEAEYGGMVVGLIHSRGVGRVMPVEEINSTRRGQQFNAER